MNRYWIIILFVFCYANGLSQTNEDVIELKNGTLLKGTISEYNPDGNTRIVLADGSVKVVSSSDIQTFSEKKGRGFFDKGNGYYHLSTVGVMIGPGEYEIDKKFQYNMTNGYKWKSLYGGVGTGLEMTRGKILTPFYADLMWSLKKGKNTPFLGFQLGKVINFGHEDEELYYNTNNFKTGNMVGGSFGLINNLSSELALVFSVGYRYYDLESKYIQRQWTGIDNLEYEVETNTILNRFNLKLGLMFN